MAEPEEFIARTSRDKYSQPLQQDRGLDGHDGKEIERHAIKLILLLHIIIMKLRCANEDSDTHHSPFQQHSKLYIPLVNEVSRELISADISPNVPYEEPLG